MASSKRACGVIWLLGWALGIASCAESHPIGRDGDVRPGTDGDVVPLECAAPSDCVLRARSCCGWCGEPTLDDMIALPRERVAAYVERVCDGGREVCPACPVVLDPYLLATCSAGACVAVDLHRDPLTVCTQHADCVLGANVCCPCGTIPADQLIAYNPSRGEIRSLFCDPNTHCTPCDRELSFGDAVARCEEGRCRVVFASSP
jgi:hypothetical protein